MCSLTRAVSAQLHKTMSNSWTAKVQMSLCICAVSPELSLLNYTKLWGTVGQRRFRWVSAYVQSHQSCLCSTSQNYEEQLDSEGSDESLHMCSLSRAVIAQLHKTMGNSWTAKVQMSLCICAVSPELSLLNYTKLWGTVGQRRFRWVFAYVQSHQSCLCSTTQNYEEQLDSEGSDESLHMCSLTRAVFAQLHKTMRNSWTAKVQMSLCICTVSSELSLLNYTKLWVTVGQRRFRWVCAYVQSHQSFHCSTTQNYEDSFTRAFIAQLHKTMGNSWTAKVQMSLCICAVSPELSLLNYTKLWEQLDSDDSDESLHMCSFTRAFIAQLHKTMGNSWTAKVQMSLCICAVSPELSLLNYTKLWVTVRQRWFRWVSAYVQSHQSCLCSTTQNYEEQLDSDGSDESLHMCSLIRAFIAQLHKTMRNSWTAMVQMSLCICAVSPELSLLNYTKLWGTVGQRRFRWVSAYVQFNKSFHSSTTQNYEEQLDSEGSDESLHMCSLTRAVFAQLHKLMRTVGQRWFRWVSAYVQFHQSCHCSTTQNYEEQLDSDGSDVSLHMCSLTRAVFAQLHKTMRNSWSAMVQMSLCIYAVSPELSLLNYTKLWGTVGQRRFRWVSAYVQSQQSFHCSTTQNYEEQLVSEGSDESLYMCSLSRAVFAQLHKTMSNSWTSKVQMSLCICAVSPELSLLNYTKLWGTVGQRRFRCVSAYVKSQQSFHCSTTQNYENSWSAKFQMSLCICAVSPELSLLNYTKLWGTVGQRRFRWVSAYVQSHQSCLCSTTQNYEEQLDSEGSDVSLHMCSLTRAPHAFLQTVKSIGDQRLFRLVCAYVQSHQSFYCSTTQNCEAHLDSEGSHEFLHMCSFTRAFIDQLHKTMSNSWSAKVQMCLCICAVSPELSLLNYTRLWVTVGQRRFTWVSAYVQFLTRAFIDQLHKTMRNSWSEKVQISLCICAVSQELSLTTYAKLWGTVDQPRFRWVCAYAQFHQSFPCFSTNRIRYRWREVVQISLCICAVATEKNFRKKTPPTIEYYQEMSQSQTAD